ncbi:PulJ/GspJ family protein [Alteromonas sp. S015]|uniref:PulJ/GspJ family protein n=1 Tax=Alteromonas sp. S015 TaxID=3117401 RepID=UPI002FDF4DBF
MSFNFMKPKRAERGFTLLEMMVVLVIVSLISVLLMQGFSFVIGLQERIRVQLVTVQNVELKEQWFRLVTRAIIREDTAPDDRFQGDNNQFSGTTLQPLHNKLGVPTQVQWRIEYDGENTSLFYSEADEEPIRIISWRGREQSFQYLDEEGVFHDEWPPEDSLMPAAFSNASNSSKSSPLPNGILLSGEQGESGYFWYVSISDNSEPLPDFAL